MKIIQLPIYKTGKSVIYKNNKYNIDYVHIKGYNIFVKLHGIDELIDSTHIICDVDTFSLQRDKNEKVE